ncbi:hypothetical protein [Amycolatopsis sp. NPDC098790]|uniref:hypothetical protein n=1 Tax=Amycolatopsis sp. NPDC098790 TaxID=3363939 RepID=UPI00380A9DF2
MHGRSRRVLVHVEHRTFTLDRGQASPADSPDSVDEPEDRLSYAGILLSYLQDDVVDREM